MKGNESMNVYYVYEFLKKRNGRVSDYEIVKKFRNATSDEIFLAKCLLEDSNKKALPVGRQKVRSKTKN